MDRQLKKKKIITFLAVVGLFLVYGMIFSFSADNAEESSAISAKVTDFLVQMYYKYTGGQAVVAETVEGLPIEEVIRKLAHFTEYMLVGLLSYGIAVLWMEKQLTCFLLVLLQLIVSGAFDEIHQYFVPGRYASVIDVVIDTAGGIAGIILLTILRKFKKLLSE